MRVMVMGVLFVLAQVASGAEPLRLICAGDMFEPDEAGQWEKRPLKNALIVVRDTSIVAGALGEFDMTTRTSENFSGRTVDKRGNEHAITINRFTGEMSISISNLGRLRFVGECQPAKLQF